MNLNEITKIVNNKEKHDVFYEDRPVWIQEVDNIHNTAKVGFVDNFEEKDVYIKDLYKYSNE